MQLYKVVWDRSELKYIFVCLSYSLIRFFYNWFAWLVARKSIQSQSFVNKPACKPIYRRKKLNLLFASLGVVHIEKKQWLWDWKCIFKTLVMFFHYKDLPAGKYHNMLYIIYLMILDFF